MTPRPRHAEVSSRLRLPRGSVRLRLTLLYGSLFLVSGAVLLAITYLLVSHATSDFALFRNTDASSHRTSGPGSLGGVLSNGRLTNPKNLPAWAQQALQQAQSAAARQHSSELHQLLRNSGVALAIMTLFSIGLGWLVAGRVLRPLRTMTTSTRRISQHNLHERLALQGPDDELKELADTIDGLLARLEAAFDAQRRFVANASHELRTPLAMMRTSLDVATGKPGPQPPQVNALETKLREGLDQADRLLESFLTLARAEHGALPEHTTVAIPQLFSEALEPRRDTITAKDIVVKATLRDVNTEGSKTLLSRMLGNVIDNAIRHNQPHGWIRLETQTRRDTIRLIIENGGAQLEESSVQELAQPFRRLAAERTSSHNGVGLGLSIVAAIATAHGGSLHLHARPEGGLQVVIELPRAPQTTATDQPA